VSLQDFANRHHKRLLYVVMPVNVGLLGEFDPALGADVVGQAAALTAELESHGATVRNLVRSVEVGSFADRWCACGHMQAPGRLTVAHAIAETLGGPVTRSPTLAASSH